MSCVLIKILLENFFISSTNFKTNNTMKHILFFKIVLLMAFLNTGNMSFSQVSEIINLTNAGTLHSYNFQNAYETINDLEITGNINADDISFMNSDMTALINIDMSASQFADKIFPVRAFSQKNSLKSVKVPMGVDSIGNLAFFSCKSLVSVEFPEGVNSLGSTIFKGCESLITVKLPKSLTFIGDHAFEYCFLLSLDRLPSNLEVIESSAFSNCHSITLTELPESLISIGGGAFYFCKSITSLKIPKNIKSIAIHTFLYCKSLVSVELPEKLNSIGRGAFLYCNSLASIEFPDSLNFIGSQAFGYCSSLESIKFPENLNSITYEAFHDCTALKSLKLPKKLTSIERKVFTNCTSLKSIEFPDSLKSIGSEAFSHCSSLDSIKLPGNLTSISQDVFAYCSSLKSIEFPGNISFMGAGMFSNCSALESFVFPENLISVSSKAFIECTSLKFIEIPEKVRSIGKWAFQDCTSLSTVKIHNSEPDSIAVGRYAFSNIDVSKCDLIVPVISVSKYSSAPVWEDFNILGGYNINVSVNNENYGSATGNGLEVTATVKAIPNKGYKFINWTSNGDVISIENPFTFIPSNDTTITANFVEEKKHYLITTSVNNAEYGTATGGGTFLANDKATLTAIANTDYEFVNWVSNGKAVSTENPFIFTVTNDLAIEAHFKKITNVGIQNIPVNISDIIIYPNPAKDILFIKSYDPIEKIILYDTNGRIISEENNNIEYLNLSFLQQGIYLIKIYTTKKEFSRKIIKQ